ncbi:MAG TPA: AAA family ATPase [Terriglobales bacterium]|nr:AAA family ATPase [Terriglobales bacterium]
MRPKAWELLCYLVERAGTLVSHDELLKRLWGDTAIQPQALTRLIFELRQVFEIASDVRIDNVARRGYRLIASLETESVSQPPPAPAAVSIAPPQLFGRTADFALLDTAWHKARGGQRQLIFVSGEPGIGKTTLVQAFLANLAGAAIACGHCPRRHGEAEPYMAVLDALEQLAETLPLATTLRRFAPAWLVQMPWLIEPDEAASLPQTLAGSGAARMLREGIRLLEALSAEQPLVLVLEDLHWSDTATIDPVRALGERSNPTRLLVIGTYRTTEIALSPHPLREVASHLVHRGGNATRLMLDSLGPASVHAYLVARFGDENLARTVAPVVERKSGGNPLFLCSLTDCLVADGTIVEAAGGWELSVSPDNLDIALPDGLREIIGEQLARLPVNHCELLEAASAAGEEFTAYELAAALERDEDHVESACIDLAQRGHFIRHVGERPWPDGSKVETFALSHALYAQVLAERIAPLRRRVLHGRIGDRLEAAYGPQAIEIAVRLASLFEAAGNVAKQASYFELAAVRAYQRFAYREMGECIGQAIEAIQSLPPSLERTRREAERWLDLANISIVAFGFNDRRAREAFDCSWELTRGGVDPLIAFRAQLGRCLTELMAFEYSGKSNTELMGIAGSVLASAQGHPELLAAAHMYNACVLQSVGEFGMALRHCVEGRKYVPSALAGIPRDADLEATLSVFEARTSASLGLVGRSRECSASALARLTTLSLPQQQVAGNTLLAEAALARRDEELAAELAATAISISNEAGVGNYQVLARALLPVRS